MHWYLAPFSWLYGIAIEVRNKLYDWKLISSEEFSLPVISVGNITVGGTGKTPLTDYLIRLLKPEFRVAFLSRGYRRKTSGYRLADADSTSRDIGDEPYQIALAHSDIHVAVDADRRRGIHRLTSDAATRDTDVVLLDDAYQHRRVVAGINIVLMDYNRMPYEDTLLPAGRLREPLHAVERAQFVVVTKCPADIRPIDFRVISNHLALRPYQHLFFTTVEYGPLRPLVPCPATLFPSMDDETKLNCAPRTITADTHVLLVTGIAAPKPLVDYVSSLTNHVKVLSYPDHHDFTRNDIRRIEEAYGALTGDDRCIVTTEKDAARLLGHPDVSDALRQAIWVQPIGIRFLKDQAENFNNHIIDYVRKNSRNRVIH